MSDDFAGTQTWSYVEEGGSWMMEIDLTPGALDLNGLTASFVRSFSLSFDGLCRAAQIYCDTMSFDEKGVLREIKEGRILNLDTVVQGRPMDEVIKEFLGEEQLFTLFLHCDVQALMPSASVEIRRSWIPRALKLYIGFGVDFGGDQPAIHGCGISVEALIDIWVPITRDPETWGWRDNRLYARLNQPLLERALRAWEQEMGNSITEWTSRYYQDQVTRYGFQGAV